jgi:hypothetical protein
LAIDGSMGKAKLNVEPEPSVVSTQIGAPHGFGLCVPDEREAGEELPAIALGDIDTLVSQDFDNCFL